MGSGNFTGISGPTDDARNHAQDHARQVAGCHRARREWGITLALVLTAVAVAMAAFSGTRGSTGDGHASRQDKASALVRAVGLGSVADTVENWIYSVNGPGNIQPDLRALGATLPGRPVSESYPIGSGCPRWWGA